MYSTHTGPIGCIMLMLWPHRYKVGHIDLILIKHNNLLKPPEIPEFSYVSHTPFYRKACPHVFWPIQLRIHVHAYKDSGNIPHQGIYQGKSIAITFT